MALATKAFQCVLRNVDRLQGCCMLPQIDEHTEIIER